MALILSIIKKICFAVVILYGLNIILTSIDIFIPINLPTIGSITILGFPGYIALLIMFFITK